jgi:hypothetical protein
MVEIATAAVALLLVIAAILLKPTGLIPLSRRFGKRTIIALCSIAVSAVAVAILLARR